jgi:hypothetical protein
MEATEKPTKKCHLCNRQFVKGEHLVRHVRTHTKERPFSCKICSKVFVRRDTLARHTRTHHPETVKLPASNLHVADSAAADPTTREIQALVTSLNLDTSILNPSHQLNSSSGRHDSLSPEESERLIASDVPDSPFDFDPKQLREIFENNGLDFAGLLNDAASIKGSGESPREFRPDLPPPPKRKRSSASSQDIDEQYRKGLADRLAPQVQTESLPSTDFMVC